MALSGQLGKSAVKTNSSAGYGLFPEEGGRHRGGRISQGVWKGRVINEKEDIAQKELTARTIIEYGQRKALDPHQHRESFGLRQVRTGQRKVEP